MSPTAPTTTNTVHASRKLKVYRYIAGVVLVALGGAAALFADTKVGPLLVAASTLAGLAAGKYLGVPMKDAITLGLQLMTPERAAEVTVAALASLPPERKEAAATALINSLPPDSLVRFSIHPPAAAPAVVSFVGGGNSLAPANDAAADEVTHPQRPSRVPRSPR